MRRARLLAAIIEAVESGRDHDTNPVTCQFERTGLVADLGQYSRLRDVTATSGTVMG